MLVLLHEFYQASFENAEKKSILLDLLLRGVSGFIFLN